MCDKFIKRNLLNRFLIESKRKIGLNNYVWKAETQKNGNLHFHLTTDKYYDSTLLRDTWNNIQKSFGLLDSFYKKYNHFEPNSTDVHSVQSIKFLDAYLLKYLKKEVDNRRSVVGRKFGCSKNLEYVHRCQFIADDEDYLMFKRLIKARPENVIENDFFTAYFSYSPEMFKFLLHTSSVTLTLASKSSIK